MSGYQSRERILAFKDLCNVIAENSTTERERLRWFSVGAALCWAGGCPCPAGLAFEEVLLSVAADIESTGGGLTDHEGNKINLARVMSGGVPNSFIEHLDKFEEE